ncbi:MAG: MupG family TIM beta-alpha barrel fold protein [Pisciglobus halotolerans]|nr:MupG family TIM beta-alpha barrel fold protein [Pisciglobus halotolerans]
MYGFSVFLGEELKAETKEEIEKLSKAGFSSIFTSLHIPEEDASLYSKRLVKLGTWAKEYQMELVADVSGNALETMGLSLNDPMGILAAGVTALRVDFGFSNQEIAKVSHNIDVALNASTINEEDVQELVTYKADFKRLTAFHNYYPRPDTGLEKAAFSKKNKWLHSMGFQVAAFVPGNKQLRGPLYQHLPTLESHRVKNPLASSIELKRDCFVDHVYIGDPSIDTFTVQQFEAYEKEKLIRLRVETKRPSQMTEFILGKHQNRRDPAKNVIRSAEARNKLTETVKPNHNDATRLIGCVTVDNCLYGRYMGETQVVITPLPADKKVNVEARVVEEDRDLLACIEAGTFFLLEKTT